MRNVTANDINVCPRFANGNSQIESVTISFLVSLLHRTAVSVLFLALPRTSFFSASQCRCRKTSRRSQSRSTLPLLVVSPKKQLLKLAGIIARLLVAMLAAIKDVGAANLFPSEVAFYGHRGSYQFTFHA